MQRRRPVPASLTVLLVLIASAIRSNPHGAEDLRIEPAPTLAMAPSTVEIIQGANNDRRATLDNAVALFRANGLDLPAFDVQFFDDAEACRGHHGLFSERTDPWRVLVCSDLAFVLPHELAHAWVSSNVDEIERVAYVEFRGLSTWDDQNAAWGDRGVEDAAFMIQQNLMAIDPNPTSATWSDRIAAYELLTGRTSPARSQRGAPPIVRVSTLQ